MTFEQFGKVLMKRWWLVVACFLLVGLGALIGSSKLIKPVYQSSVLIEVIVRSGGDPLTIDNVHSSQQIAVAEADLATSSQVLSSVASRYPGLTVDALKKEVTAAPKDSTQLLEIDVLDPNPVRAANLANDIATTLINQQLQVIQAPVAQSNFLTVTQSAQPALSPARPNNLISIGAGLVIGLLLGMLLAVLLELLDTRVGTKEALFQLVHWPIMSTIWQTSPKEAIIYSSDYNLNIDSYDMLHMNIGFATIDKPWRTLVITSITPHEGKSTIAANLAMCMAKTGKETLLVDANLRHPQLHDIFNIPADAPGFSNAIVAYRTARSTYTSADRQRLTPATNTNSQPAGTLHVTDNPSLSSFVHVVDTLGLYVMPSGPLPPNPPELLDSKAMQRLFAGLSNCGAEVVILDTPSLLDLSDASILASKADATLVVVDTAHAHRGDLKQAKMLLEQAGAYVVGCVVNKQRRTHKNAPYTYYYSIRHRIAARRKNTKSSLVSPATPTPTSQAGPSVAPVRQAIPSKSEQLDGEMRVTSDFTSLEEEEVGNEKERTVTIPALKRRAGE